MNSAIEELKEALRYLTGTHNVSSKVPVGGEYTMVMSDTGFDDVFKRCNSISAHFNGVNTSLEDGWETSAELFNKLYKTLQDSLTDMYNDILKFAEESSIIEEKAKKASERANEEAENILRDLDLLVSDKNSTKTPYAPPEPTAPDYPTRPAN